MFLGTGNCLDGDSCTTRICSDFMCHGFHFGEANTAEIRRKRLTMHCCDRFFKQFRAMGQDQSFSIFPTHMSMRSLIEKCPVEEFYVLLESSISTFGHALIKFPPRIASFLTGNITQ